MLSTLLLVLCSAPAAPVPTIELRDVLGQTFQPMVVPAGKAAAAIVFVTGDCPISNAYAPELNRVVAAYESRGVVFYLVHVDRDIGRTAAAKHAKEYGFRCTVLLDPAHRLVEALGATVTPEACVVDRKGTLVYRGRIDDRYPSLGVHRQPKKHDLRIALDAALAGRKVPAARTKAVGCLIPSTGG